MASPSTPPTPRWCTPTMVKEYLINLIDTPGHVDFGGDVTRAMRALDGCIILVCAVEGIMPQTETVIRQALKERVRPVLFINKVDRLINELKVTQEQMQQRFVQIITEVNKQHRHPAAGRPEQGMAGQRPGRHRRLRFRLPQLGRHRALHEEDQHHLSRTYTSTARTMTRRPWPRSPRCTRCCSTWSSSTSPTPWTLRRSVSRSSGRATRRARSGRP